MILHLDMDAFFASVEQMDNPELRGKPVIIGGRERGVVATASYEARVFGVHSAMPMATARKLCPHGIYVAARGARYVEISRAIMACLKAFSPVVQAASIDEAYLDISARVSPATNINQLAGEIKSTIAGASGGLTCSIGIAPVKFLAKICSDINKPNGLFALAPEEVYEFLEELPVGKIPGVGGSMQRSLASYGIHTTGQLRRLSREFLEKRYGKWGAALYERSRGIDPRQVHENLPAKSESAERTFARDVFDKAQLRGALRERAEKVSGRLRRHGLAGRTITVKIKFSDFQIITRSRTLESQICSADAICEAACAILDDEKLPRPVRLIGVGVSGFDWRPVQLPLPGMTAFGAKNGP